MTTLSDLHHRAHALARREGDLRWERGRVLAAVRRDYGDDACAELMQDLADTHGIRYSRMNQERWLAECYTPEQVVDGLTFTHHRLAATMPDELRAAALEYARNEGLNTRQLEEWLKSKTGADEALPFADPIELERDAYALRRVAELCDDISDGIRARVAQAAIRALDEWYDAQMRESQLVA